jgi:uncharacterized protein YcgL (UPF0745 family)
MNYLIIIFYFILTENAYSSVSDLNAQKLELVKIIDEILVSNAKSKDEPWLYSARHKFMRTIPQSLDSSFKEELYSETLLLIQLKRFASADQKEVIDRLMAQYRKLYKE